MPAPSSSLATLRPDITDSFTEFDLEMNFNGLIASKVFPVFDVPKASGNFGKIPLEQLLQKRNTLRAPGSGYSRGNWTFEPDTYITQEYGAEEPVDDNQAEMYSDYFDAEVVSGARARSAVLMNAEERVAAAVFNAAIWTGAALSTAVSNEWDDAVNATPIEDVFAAKHLIWDGSGLHANALIINWKVLDNLKNSEQVIERINSQGAGNPSKPDDINEAMLRAVFGLQHIIVAGAALNTATEGQAATIASPWSSEYAMVCRVATGNDFREPCIGRTFHWAQDGSSYGGTAESYRDETVRADIIRVRHQVGEKRLYAQAGHLLSNITT